jgi:GT2 family glycosyltransferase
MNTHPSISVVITTYNRSDALLAVLVGLQCQNDTQFDVVVADDGSGEEHVNAILGSPAAKLLNVTHVWHPDVGFTAARIRNRGVAASHGEYIVFLDGDCVPENDFIAQHRRLAQTGYFVNGSRIMLSPDLTRQITRDQAQISARSWMFWFSQYLKGQASKLTGLIRLPDLSFRRQQTFTWKGIRSCNMGVWRSDFERVDGFDESFVGWGHEDADFVLRLHNCGLFRKNGFCATEVFHLWHAEASRKEESENAKRVKAREKSNVTMPILGYSRQRLNDDGVITRLG